MLSEEEKVINQAKYLRFYSIEKLLIEDGFGRETLQTLSSFLDYEEQFRKNRHISSCIQKSKVGVFETVAEFDWKWPSKIDRDLIEELFTFKFVKEKVNIVMLGANGVGKTMLAKNLIHQAACSGTDALFINSAEMLDDILSQQRRDLLERSIKKYVKPKILAIDEVGYLSYDSRHADILFQVINRRAECSTIITTNRPFGEWQAMFPNSASVTALVDRLTERCEIVQIEAESYRNKRHKERMLERAQKKKKK
jgi:DNA replication protein DnaC